MAVRATDVFTPGSFPERTYVERAGTHLEQMLRDSLDTDGQVVSLVGPSKSGKTVLVEKVVGRDQLITVTGAGIQSPNDIWARALDWMGAPNAVTKTATTSGSLGVEGAASGGLDLFSVAKTSVEVKGTSELTHERGTSKSTERSGLTQVVKDIAHSEYVLLLDDFHYMPRDIQADAAKSLKEAARLGIKVCTAGVADGYGGSRTQGVVCPRSRRCAHVGVGRRRRSVVSPGGGDGSEVRRGLDLDTSGYAAYMFDVVEKAVHHGAAVALDATHDENGVDLTLIRVYLGMTPIERVRSLQNAVRAIERFRYVDSTKAK